MPARDQLAADTATLVEATQAATDAAPVYGQEAYDIVRAERQAKIDLAEAEENKAKSDQQLLIAENAVKLAKANCKPPEVKCIDDAVTAAEVALKPLQLVLE